MWLDAVAYDRAGEEIEEKQPKELLAPIKSYGYVLKEDQKAIILAYEDSDDQKSFVVIPKKWIKSIIVLGKKAESMKPAAKAFCSIAKKKGRKSRRSMILQTWR